MVQYNLDIKLPAQEVIKWFSSLWNYELYHHLLPGEAWSRDRTGLKEFDKKLYKF